VNSAPYKTPVPLFRGRVSTSVCWCVAGFLAVVVSSPAPSEVAPPSANAREFDCIVEPQQVVKLSSPVVGVIAQLHVDRGDFVQEGQIVGKLEDGVEAAALDLAQARAANVFTIGSFQARLHFLRRKQARLGELHTKAVSSLAALEEAEAEAKVVEQQLKEAELNKELARLQMRHAEEVLRQRTLRSPINGVVVERLLRPGEYQNENTPVLTLAQIDTLRVEVFVPTSYYGQIVVGSVAHVRPEDPIGGSHSAVVTVVDRVLDAASSTFGIRLALPNPDLSLPAGIRCTVAFGVASGEGVDSLAATGSKLR
jgi:RND family efflux transporter MFP subunit